MSCEDCRLSVCKAMVCKAMVPPMGLHPDASWCGCKATAPPPGRLVIGGDPAKDGKRGTLGNTETWRHKSKT